MVNAQSRPGFIRVQAISIIERGGDQLKHVLLKKRKVERKKKRREKSGYHHTNGNPMSLHSRGWDKRNRNKGCTASMRSMEEREIGSEARVSIDIILEQSRLLLSDQ